MRNGGEQSGFTLLEVIIGLAILAIVSTAVFFTYFNVLKIVQSSQFTSAALDIMESELEAIRNMPYEQVGVVGGVPAGILQPTRTVTLDNTPFTLNTYVRVIDDPFDGTFNGSPRDLSPSDYKLVELQVSCDQCANSRPVALAALLAPTSLEVTSKNGALLIRALDASGQPVPGATVHVTNPNVRPAIDLTDVTDVNGTLQLLDIPSSSAGYHITMSKTGYSSDQTVNPAQIANALNPDATVVTQQLTIKSLAIDHVSSLLVRARDQMCAPVAGMDFTLTGSKLLGTSPNVPKYSAPLTTDSLGRVSLPSLEWDLYTITPTDAALDIAGIQAPLAVTIDPATSHQLDWMIAQKSGNGVSASVADAAGNAVNGATVHMHGGTYDKTVVTGQSTFGNLSAPLVMTPLPDGTYASGAQTFESPTFDVGSTSITYTALNWSPSSQDPRTGADSVTFQIAANNDNATWNYIDPSDIDTLQGNRYFRYRAILTTADPTVSPVVNAVSVSFTGGCAMPGQAYFNGLAVGSYTMDVSAPGFQSTSVPVTVSGAWQRIPVTLSP